MTLRELLNAATPLGKLLLSRSTRTGYQRLKDQRNAYRALVFDMADVLRAINDPELSDLSDTAFHWHGMHTANREDEAEDCIVCRVRVLLAWLDRISTQTQGEGVGSIPALRTPPSACACDHGITLSDKETGAERCAECGEDCGTA